MTKTKAKGPDYSKVTPALLKQVKEVIAEGDKHRYSVSGVYGAYNAAFDKKDTPQTCSSCMRNRVRELRKWMEGYEAFLKEQKKSQGAGGKEYSKKVSEGTETGQNGSGVVQPQYADPDAPGFVAPADGVTRTPMADGLPFDFTPGGDDPNKGTVLLADGTTVKPGTYKTARGTDIAVQPGGKATIKENDNPEDLL